MTFRSKVQSIIGGKIGVAFFIICCFFFQTPQEITIIPFFGKINVPVCLLLGVILIFLFITQIKDIKECFKYNLILVFGIIFCAVRILSTILNHGYIKSSLWACGVVPLGYMVLLSIFFKVNAKRFAFAMYVYYLAVSVLNAISVFIFFRQGWGLPYAWGGLPDMCVSLVGNINKAAEYVFIMILLGTILAKHFKVKVTIINYIAMVICLAAAFFCESWTQVIAFGLIIVVMIIADIEERCSGKYKSIKIFNAKVLCLLELIPFIAVVLLGRTGWMEKIGIASDLHGRGVIWDSAINVFLHKPILGIGILTPEDMVSITGSADGFHCHSILVDTAFATGAIGLILFIVIVILCTKSIDKISNLSVRFSAGLFFAILFLALIIEVYAPVMLFAIFGVYWYFSKNQISDNT